MSTKVERDGRRATFLWRTLGLGRRMGALLAPGIVLLAWETVVRRFAVPEYLLPPPSAIAIYSWHIRWVLLGDLWVTAKEAIAGLAIGVTVGFLFASLFAHSRLAERTIYPFAIAVKTVPVIALAPLVTMWFGFGVSSKMIIVALICYFPSLVNTLRGFRAVNQDVRDYMASIAATRWQFFWKVRLPWSMPYVFAGLRIASSFAVLGAVIGEFVGADAGLGYSLLMASYRNETTTIFANLLAASLLGIVLFRIVVLTERRVVPWQEAALEDLQ